MILIILIVMIILNIIYHISGLVGILSILVWTINLFLTTMILIQNPENFWIRIIQLLSIFFIVFIIMLDISTFYSSFYKFAFIIPLSINKITYLEDLVENEGNNKISISKIYTDRFYFNDYKEVSEFINSLENDKSYLITFEFIFLSWLQYEEDNPALVLSKPIIISKDSNPWLISNFIKNRINLACNNYYLDEDMISEMIGPDAPGILVKYSEIEIS